MSESNKVNRGADGDSEIEAESSPVVLEMELPPPSDGENRDEETRKINESILKKVKKLEAQVNILMYAIFITPFILLGVVNHREVIGFWFWPILGLFYSPVLIYLITRLCASFCVTKPLTPAELAYLQENDD